MMQNTIEHSSSHFVEVNTQQQAILCDILPKLYPLDTELLDELSSSYKLYNAVYDLAEQLYLHGVPLDDRQRIIQILSMGRISAVQLISAHVASDENTINNQNISLNDDISAQETALLDESPIVSIDESVLVENTSSLPTNIPLNTDEFEQTKLSLEKTDEHLTPIFPVIYNHKNNNIQETTLVEKTSSLPTNIPLNADGVEQVKVSLEKTDERFMPNVPVIYVNHENQYMSFFKMSQNAQVGVPYRAKIIMYNQKQQKIHIIANSVKLSHNIGLYFDEQLQEVCGQPTQVVEDFYIEFRYTSAQQLQAKYAKVQLIINPNPRDIWQEHEPAADVPYAKSHTAHQQMSNTLYDIYAVRRRGRTHAHTGTYCDDDFFIRTLAEHHWSILVVSDGAGSAKFSREGSKIAVNIVGEYLVKYVQQYHTDLERLLSQWQIGQPDPDEQTQISARQLYDMFDQQFYDAGQEALNCIEQKVEHQEAKMRDFASTLLVAVTKHDAEQTFVASFAIGDGAICAYHTERNVVLMNEPDAGEHAGQTQFLDDIHKTQKQRTHVRYLQGHYHVMLMTDGISDPMFASDAELQSADCWHRFWQNEIAPQLQHQQPSQALLTWSNFYSDGHHDDRTFILLYAKQRLQTARLESSVSSPLQIDTYTTTHFHHQE